MKSTSWMLLFAENEAAVDKFVNCRVLLRVSCNTKAALLYFARIAVIVGLENNHTNHCKFRFGSSGLNNAII